VTEGLATLDLRETMRLVRFPSWIIDREGRVVWENDAAIELFGDMRGKLYASLVAPGYLAVAQEQFARKLLGQPVTDYELVMRTVDGLDVPVEISSVPIPDRQSGIPLGIFGVARPEELPGRPPPSPSSLTPREAEALRYLAAGGSTQQIADTMGLSAETVRNHIRGVLRKLGAHSRLEAVAVARKRGLLG
jgi:PAS domain S-box-containing protein